MTPERERPLAPKLPGKDAQQATDLPWARVEAELRAYREEQRRAWGDVDNTTLGRYLAGEGSADERQQVEKALDELPELRKLTDLVRDVLEDYEPASAAPPAVLTFTPPAPFSQRKHARRLQYASLALAASLLLTLGVALPHSNMLGQVFDLPASTLTVASLTPVGLPPADEEDLDNNAVAFDAARKREEMFRPNHAKLMSALPPRPEGEDGKKEVSRDEGPLPSGTPIVATSVGGGVGSPVMVRGGREDKGKKSELQQVVVLSQWAEAYQRAGDFTEAASNYSQAHRLCLQTYGPDHPKTRRTRNQLAQTYQVALNSTGKQAYRQDNLPAASGRAVPAAAHPNDRRYFNHSLRAARPLQQELLECSPAQLKADVVPVLTEALSEAKTSEERQQLAQALGRLGPAARPAVPVLVETLQKRAQEPGERSVLLGTLGQIGSGARQTLPVLVDSVCNDTAPQARQSAAEALVEMGPAARGAVSELIKPGKANDPLVRDVLRHIRGRDGRIGVCDECDCFSASALSQARDTIRSLAQKADVEVLVETVSALPPAATEQATNDLGPRGIHVVIAKDDRSVRVRVAPALQQQGLTLVALARAFAGPLRHKQLDASLRDGLAFIARVEKATPSRR